MYDESTIDLVVLQSLWWCCINCVIHHEQDVREKQHHTYMWRKQAQSTQRHRRGCNSRNIPNV